MNKFFRISRRTWILGCFLSLLTVLAQTLFATFVYSHNITREDEPTSRIRLFETDEVLSLTILSDFSSIMDDRGEDRAYHKGLLYYLTEEGDTIFRKIKLKSRGNFRRDPGNCKYPPIMIKFSKLKTPDSIFTDQSKLKLVTQCQQEDYVLLEYLAYRINNIITDQSYRVRLAHITYTDLKTRNAYFTRYAFFIENEDKMAQRIGGEIYSPNVVQYFLDRENVLTMAMFQYLIGNHDWYVTSKHNLSILKLAKDESLIAVPYDFDWSRLVDASYARPLGVPYTILRDYRVYKGLCMEKDDFLSQQKIFNSKKDSILNFVQSFDIIPKGKRQNVTRYMHRFYHTLNREWSLDNIFKKEECISEPEFGDK